MYRADTEIGQLHFKKQTVKNMYECQLPRPWRLKKRGDVLNYRNVKNYDFYFLQDTHFTCDEK